MQNKELSEVLQLAERQRIRGQWAPAIAALRAAQGQDAWQTDESQARLWLALGRTQTDEAMFRGVDTLAEGKAALERARQLVEPQGESALLGEIYEALGFALHVGYVDSDRTEEPAMELPYFERAHTLLQAHGDACQQARILFHLGLVHDVLRRDYAQARPYHEAAYVQARAAGDPITQSYAIRHLGFVYLTDEDWDAAKAALQESLALREAAEFVPGVAYARLALGHLAERLGDREQALQHVQEARAMLVALEAEKRVAWIDGVLARWTKAAD